MKRLLLLWAYFTCQVLCLAQTIVNPTFERCDVPEFHITKVEITKDTTYVYCSCYAEAGSWATISPKTYLRDSKSNKKFPLQRCEGLPYSPKTKSFSQAESYEVLFCFPSIEGTELFDFIENEDKTGFNIYGINLTKRHKTNYTDIELQRISEMVLAYNSSSNTEKTILLKDYAISLNNLVSYNASIGNHAEAVRLGKVEVMIREKVFGLNHPSYIKSLRSLVGFYSVLGSYHEAMLLEKKVVKVLQRTVDSKNSDYVESLNELASYQVQIGNYQEALQLGKEIVEIYNKKYGVNNPHYATALSNLSTFYAYIGNYSEAIIKENEAMEIRKRVLGTEHPQYAMSLNNLAASKSLLGNYSEAIELGTEAVEKLKRVLGTEHPQYALSLSSLAAYNSNIGKFSDAIRLETEAVEKLKRVLGTEHPEYVRAISALATYYTYIGNYAEAIRLGTEALEIRKKNLGTLHLDYTTSLNNLAVVNSYIGNYSEAIELGTEAMEICKRVLGTEHPQYATSLNNLAVVNSHIGNYSEAIRLGTEAMEIRKRVLGTEHPQYATSLNNLAVVNSHIGNYSEAIRLGTEAMEIRKRVLGSDHPDYAMSLNNLATYYTYISNYAEAIELGTEAMEIQERVLGSDHPDYATSLSSLATLNSYIGIFSNAIRLETEAMEIRERVLGTEHPDYLLSLGNLASHYYICGNYEKAYYFMKQQIGRSHNFILKRLGDLSSNYQKSLWTAQFASMYFSSLPSMVYKFNKESISELYNNTCLFAKGILLNTGIEMRKLILESRDSSLIHKYNDLSTNINIYNKLIEKPLKEHYMNADSLGSVIQKQEMELARDSKAYGDYTRNLTITWKDVQQNLGKGDIAIEFLDYPIVGTNSKIYIALTVKNDYDTPHMVTLFEKSQLEVISEDDYYTKTDVSNLIWKPLEEELKGVNNIYFAPSGDLHKIGVEYLPLSRTETIGDIYILHRLSSTRQLAVIRDSTKGKNTILYGGINFDEKSNKEQTDSVLVEKNPLRSAFSRANVDSLSLRSSFDYLEGTKLEADMIAADMKQHRLPYIYYSGKDGSEESFKQLNGTKPKVMHIATHGFYLTESEAEKSKYARHEPVLMTDRKQIAGRTIEDKPMTRSGLLFSGCNRAFRHEKIPEREEDGILTAQEISTLDLRGLDLVVLSACQTGLGDVISGEGVFGLQRGFKKAGANTILMSLNKVDDEATRILMVEFYRNLMSGKTKRQSLQDAQQYLRKVDNGKYDAPKYWASFIMLDGMD